MNKIIVYIVLICLIPGASQLFKLPGLMMHYQEHKKLSTTALSFTSFIYEHYFENENSNDSAHKNLPFKHLNNNTIVACIHPSITIFHFTQISKEENIVYGTSQTQHTSSCILSIWQPPRIS
jgi:hypothetical protein